MRDRDFVLVPAARGGACALRRIWLGDTLYFDHDYSEMIWFDRIGGRRRAGKITAPPVPERIGRAAVAMTQQYLVGELLHRLGRLQDLAPGGPPARDLARLRREAETTPPTGLRRVVARALRLADTLCWGSLACGDVAAFDRGAGAAADLFEFGVCSGLVGDHHAD